jgi:hypothetical protein
MSRVFSARTPKFDGDHRMKRSQKIFSCMTAFALMSSVAVADEDFLLADDDPSVSSYEDEFDFLVEGERNAAQMAEKTIYEDDDFAMWDDDGEEFGEFQLRLPNPEPALPLPFSVVGRKPLVDNYGASVVYTDRDSIVVELPILVTRNPGDFTTDFWLIGEIHVGGQKVAESRQFVSSTSLAQAGPTVAFLKMLVPVETTKGEVEFKVFKSADGESREALFTNILPYQL